MHKASILSNTEIDGTHSIFVIVDDFLNTDQINFYNYMLNEINDWKDGQFYGGKTPRLQKWYHDDNKYFGNYWNNQNHDRWKSNKTDNWLKDLRNKIQIKIDDIFKNQINDKYIGCNKPQLNSTLINYYRDGNDYIRYHHDDEKIFGDNPTVSILTFGSERELKFKRTYLKDKKFCVNINENEYDQNKSFKLKPGSLFIMMGSVQKYYCHGIEKDENIKNGRYSLTFREHKN